VEQGSGNRILRVVAIFDENALVDVIGPDRCETVKFGVKVLEARADEPQNLLSFSVYSP
jgi:hypothetical protein